jgi:hypothetical protein
MGEIDAQIIEQHIELEERMMMDEYEGDVHQKLEQLSEQKKRVGS